MYLKIDDSRIETSIDKQKADIFAALMLERLNGEVKHMKLMKLLYFADRYHLRRYMRPIAFDNYYAMQKGVIGSHWLNLLRGIAKSEYFINTGFNFVKLKRKVGQEVAKLSESEEEAMNFALEKFGRFNENELVSLLHEYPEWKKHEKWLKEHPDSRQDIDIRDIFSDPEDNVVFTYYQFEDPFKKLSADERELILEELGDHASEIA